MALGFQLSAGSIPGRSHLGSGNLLIGKNNQDAFNFEVLDDCVIAIVLDGCGSGSHSEVGANVGGRLLTRLIRNAVRDGALNTVTSCEKAEMQLEKIREEFLVNLMKIVRCMIGIGNPANDGEENGTNSLLSMQDNEVFPALERLIHDCFLFTIVGLVVTPESAIFFSIGDGIFAINGRISQIGPFPNNAPPYISYGLIPQHFQFDSALLRFQVHSVVPTHSLQSALIATDGMQELIEKKSKHLPGKTNPVGNISRLWNEDRFFDEEERELITPWLRQVNSEVVKLSQDWLLERSLGLLSDDTTVIALRRNKS